MPGTSTLKAIPFFSPCSRYFLIRLRFSGRSSTDSRKKKTRLKCKNCKPHSFICTLMLIATRITVGEKKAYVNNNFFSSSTSFLFTRKKWENLLFVSVWALCWISARLSLQIESESFFIWVTKKNQFGEWIIILLEMDQVKECVRYSRFIKGLGIGERGQGKAL